MMVNVIEAALNVTFYEPARTMKLMLQVFERGMTTSVWSESM
jgi:diaminopimelate epimerase